MQKTPPDIHSPITTEYLNLPLSVLGEIPEWLSGTFVRNGPVDIEVNGKDVNHWFDGLAMLHAFSFQYGKVSYTNRFLRSSSYRKIFEEGSLDYLGFAVDPCKSLFSRFFSLFFHAYEKDINNANVNVAKYADSYVALTETPLPVRFDLTTLQTLGVFNFNDKELKERCFESAHPHHDPIKKETINYLVEYGKKSFYTLYRIKDGSSSREVIAKIPVKEPSYMHSFSVTENTVVFTQYPFVVNPLDLMLKGKAFIHNFKWKPELGTKIILVDRKQGKVLNECTTDPFFSFHHANAYEEDGSVILDLISYDDASIISELSDFTRWQNKRSPKVETKLTRLKIPFEKGTILMTEIVDELIEFPRINEFYDGKKYRYLYAADFRGIYSPSDQRKLYKIDMHVGEVSSWSKEGCQPGEPVFIASPNGTKEDHGVILAIVIDQNSKNAFLLVLDAKTFKELGRAVVPHIIPEGLHGQFFP